MFSFSFMSALRAFGFWISALTRRVNVQFIARRSWWNNTLTRRYMRKTSNTNSTHDDPCGGRLASRPLHPADPDPHSFARRDALPKNTLNYNFDGRNAIFGTAEPAPREGIRVRPVQHIISLASAGFAADTAFFGEHEYDAAAAGSVAIGVAVRRRLFQKLEH